MTTKRIEQISKVHLNMRNRNIFRCLDANVLGVRVTTSIHSNFLSILQEKTYFFYFTYRLLQNAHISLSILHIYSIKYSFFYIFYYFLTHGLSLSLSLSRTQPPSSSPSHHQAKTQIFQTQALWFFRFSFSWLIGAKTQMKLKPR